jgi:hypothetical protein
VAHTSGYNVEEIACIAPTPILLAIHFMLFPKDYAEQLAGRMSVRTWVAVIVFLLIAWAHA